MKSVISDIKRIAALLFSLQFATTYKGKMQAYHNAVIYLQKQTIIGRRVSKIQVIKLLKNLLMDVRGYDSGDRREVFTACVLSGCNDEVLELISGYKTIAPWRNRILSQHCKAA